MQTKRRKLALNVLNGGLELHTQPEYFSTIKDVCGSECHGGAGDITEPQLQSFLSTIPWTGYQGGDPNVWREGGVRLGTNPHPTSTQME